MRFASPEAPSFSARWTSRVAVFAAVCRGGRGLAPAAGHADAGCAQSHQVAFAGAILALVLAVLAAARIWRTGSREPPGGGGDRRARCSAGRLVYAPTVATLPEINDVTTDTAAPPPFVALAAQRQPGANSPLYPGEGFAVRQAQAYPDLQPLRVERSVEETYELAAPRRCAGSA